MRLPIDVIENPNRRRYHLVVGILIVTMILTMIVAGVRATLDR